jgi:hypothetical protein
MIYHTIFKIPKYLYIKKIMKLTDRIQSPSGFTTNQTYIHVVDTNNPTQDPAGSSYKSTIDEAISGSPIVVIISGTGINSSIRRDVNNIASGDNSATLGGGGNTVTSNFSSIVGGCNNIISGGTHSFIGGGLNNLSSGSCSTIGGGLCNISSGSSSTIGGGRYNRSLCFFSTVGGGVCNVSSDGSSTIGGGRYNTSSSYSSTIGGGRCNRTCPSSNYSTIGGGNNNQILSGGTCATIGGGVGNITNNPSSTIGGGCNNKICFTTGGQSSTIGGGVGNIICGQGYRSTISGGKDNHTSGGYTFIGGGGENCATGQGSIVVGGLNNSASSAHAVIVGGRRNCILGACCSFIGGGRYNLICCSGTNQFLQVIVGGCRNITNNRYSTIVGGGYGSATRFGQRSFALGPWDGFTGSTCQGQSQHIELLARNTTTGATPVNVFLNGVSQRIDVINGTAMFVTINIAGIKDDGSSAAHYIRKVAIKNVAGTTSLIGTVSTIGTDVEDNVNYDVDITADDTNDALNIEVTGDNSENIRWTVHINGLEIKYEWS